MRLLVCLLAGSVPGFAQAADNIDYGTAPAWVEPPPRSSSEPIDEGAFYVRFNDTQVRVTDLGTSTFSTYRIKIMQPEALQIGNLNVAWNPDTTDVTVNRLIIHRDGQPLDMLKDHKFRVFQREGRLEQAMLDGFLTANLQIPGLRIGDEIEFAITVIEHSTVFGANVFGALALPVELAPGTYRLGLSWTPGHRPRWLTSPDIEDRVSSTSSSVSTVLDDPGKLSVPREAPSRYGIGRFIQFSSFKDWSDLSRKTFDLFDAASQLPDDAGLDARIQKIAQAGDQHAKAIDALALVQDSIRYVYTGMDGGNYVPASAHETWDRRFGDCKGKSALLLGILKRLGIEAQSVLVSTAGADGLDAWLPSPDFFDHVVLRILVDGRRYWLDGTRTGDSHLLSDDEVPYRWVLPLSAEGETLQKIAYLPPKQPREIDLFDIDATAGTEEMAKVKFTRVLRGDKAFATNLNLKTQTTESSRQTLMKAFAGGWFAPEDASWEFDERSGALAMRISGKVDLEWESDDSGPSLALPGGGFYPPDKRERPKDEDQTAPYANEPGRFSCSLTRMHLPRLPKGHWETGANKIDQVIGGVAYYRQVNLKDDTISLVRSSRTQLAEISSAAAEEANAMIPGFDNSKVTVETHKGSRSVDEISDPSMPDFSTVDLLEDGSICMPERVR